MYRLIKKAILVHFRYRLTFTEPFTFDAFQWGEFNVEEQLAALAAEVAALKMWRQSETPPSLKSTIM